MQRRQFLGFIAVSSGLFLPSCRSIRAPAAKRVVVVGGGYGGATTAKYLKLFDPTLDVTLVEKDREYFSCVGSNEVLAGWRELGTLTRTHDELQNRRNINLVRGTATQFDGRRRLLILSDGSSIRFDRLIVSPGISMKWDAIEGYTEATAAKAPHAWKAGSQTLQLRAMIEGMRDGGTVVISAPQSPYRCPPGPYERASLIASYLKRRKPRSKVLILDAKTQFPKQALFQQGWSELYPGVIEWISAKDQGQIERVDVDKGLVVTEFHEHRGDVLNIIPPQQAGAFAATNGLTDKSGWCPVDPISFESSLHPGVHVIGDACIANPMPKSAFSANSQAKVCAAAVVALLRGEEPGLPSLINHCYSFLEREYAISITGIYEVPTGDRQIVSVSGGETPKVADRKKEADFARSWQLNIAADSFDLLIDET